MVFLNGEFHKLTSSYIFKTIPKSDLLHWLGKSQNFVYVTIQDVVLFWLVWFYDILTFVDYLIPNPVYSYIADIWFVNISQ